jgi:enoyl-CoA hydratase/carnithine racemase
MSLITASKINDVLHISFRDPKSRNSFSHAAALDLKKALSHTHDCSALVFTAEGSVFSSGGQLDDYARMTKPDEGIAVNDEIRGVLSELSSLKIPTVCAVTGDCFGGGVELISAFDFILTTPNAFFALWIIKI